MFDLIDESGQDLRQFGYSVKDLTYGATLAYLNVNSADKAERLEFPLGEYFIINAPIKQGGDKFFNYISGVLANCLKRLFKKLNKHSKILLVGLGNPDILADCLGKAVLDNIEIDALDKKNRCYKICPNIYPITGIETFDFVKFIKEGVGADAVIVIDSLATKEITRLACSFQISSAGLTPGSGVNNLGTKICEESLGVPCISIGVPLMCYARGLNKDAPELILTPKDIHENLYTAAYIISKALNAVIF